MSAKRRADRGNSWWVDFVYRFPDGHTERVRRASPVNTRQGAEKYEQQLRQRILEHGNLKDRGMTFGEFSKEYLRLRASEVKPATIASIDVSLRNFFLPEIGGVQLSAIDARMCEEISMKLKSRYKETSGWQMLHILQAMLRCAVRWGYLDALPSFDGIRRPAHVEENTDFLTFDEADALGSAASEIGTDIHLAVMLALKAGLRIGEIGGLRWSDWNGSRRELSIQRQLGRDGRMASTKSGKGRVVPVPSCLASLLDAYAGQPDEPVVKKSSHSTLDSALTRAVARAGISRTGSRISMHDLRHTYASHLAMKGVALQVIQKLLGHASITMTQRYAHLLPDTMSAAVMALEK